MPFITAQRRVTKYLKHGAEFGAASEVQFETMADAFCTGVRDPTTTFECTRPRGMVLRYNPSTEAFGVLNSSGMILTYYKPRPVIHGKANNCAYFLEECSK